MTATHTFDEKTLTLVRKKLTQVLQVPAEMLAVDVTHSFFEDAFLVRLKATIYGEELPPHTETRYAYEPATWWCHFKHTYADRWWLRAFARRWPPEMKTITLTATWENMAAYPWAQLRTQPTPGYLGAAVRLTMPLTSILTGDDEDDD
jgi:hypothetical protein